MKNEVGRPLIGKNKREPVNALVEPATIIALDAWGSSRGIIIDRLVEKEIERLNYNSQG